MASTTLLTFLLRTPRNVTSVQLVGSWDNFKKTYPMKRDVNLGGAHWRGCHSFTGIICDGEPSQAREEKRDGGLLMGGRYWYFYQLDDDIEYHDPTQPSTTSCPFLPGQMVNVLDVPIQIAADEDMALGPSTSCVPLATYTMDPEEKYRTLRPPSSAGRTSISTSCSGYAKRANGDQDAGGTLTTYRSRSSLQEAYSNFSNDWKSIFKRGRPCSEPIQVRLQRHDTSSNLRRCRSAGCPTAREIHFQPHSQDYHGFASNHLSSSEIKLFNISPDFPKMHLDRDLESISLSETGSGESFIHRPDANLTQLSTNGRFTHMNSTFLEAQCSRAHGTWLDLDSNETEDETTEAEGPIARLSIGADNSGPNLELQEGKRAGQESTDEISDAFPGKWILVEHDGSASRSNADVQEGVTHEEIAPGTTISGAAHISSSASSARTSGFFSSLSTASNMGYVGPSGRSQPITPTTSEPGEYILRTAYASPRPLEEADVESRADPSGLIGYSLPEAEHASVLTLRNLQTATSKSSQGDLERASKSQIVEAWNDGSELQKTALQELVDDLGYLGAIIA